ncbi:MAG TPA: hypothetical protein VD707_05215 [Gemmatimonadales bacterium]|nr:hypothetical protein [Gemmatimonadales bacterium]
MPLLLTLALAFQAPPEPLPAPRATAAVRAGLDTLYGGAFQAATRHFARLAAVDTADPAPVVFEAGAYIWWAASLDSAAFARRRVDSLLALAITRARRLGPAADFWLATAHGYRARERDVHGQTWGAAKDGKAMRDAYRRVLRADPECVDCYLGLGVYHYGLARAPAVARFVARLVGLGSGNADSAFAYLRRASAAGDLAAVEATWVLAAALERDAARARDAASRAALEAEARTAVAGLAARYPANPVFARFLGARPEPAQ